MDKTDSDLLKLEEFLPYRLSVLSNTVSTAIAAGYARRFELTIPEWRVMAILGRYPGASAGEVAGHAAMDKVAVSRAVGRLEQAGYLSRSSDREDRRRVRLTLSTRGKRLFRRIAPWARSYESRLLESLSPAERAELDRLLEQLLERAREL